MGLPLFDDERRVARASKRLAFGESVRAASEAVFGRQQPEAFDVSEAYRELARKIGRRYAGCTLDGFEISTTEDGRRQAAVVGRLREYAKAMPERVADGCGIMLYGRPGTGKDHLLAALAIEAIVKWRLSVAWVNGSDLYSMFRQRIVDDEGEESLVATYQRPRIFILSDPVPPRGEITGYQAQMLFRIIDRRYRDKRPTWTTLNVGDDGEMDRRLAANLRDRLRHGAVVLECEWKSYRRELE